MRASKILSFLSHLHIDEPLPSDVTVLNPYQDTKTFNLCRQFYTRFYNDDEDRACIIGINPGRFGAGLTGIPFTDPEKLEVHCGIPNDLPKRTELSADFIYAMITAKTDVEMFYRRFYITAVSPLGFTREGKNLNYYDDKALMQRLEPFMHKCLQTQLSFGINRKVCYCLGEGKNFTFISSLNSKYDFFEKVIPLAHPRFIMQYKRKKIADYIDAYYRAFSEG